MFTKEQLSNILLDSKKISKEDFESLSKEAEEIGKDLEAYLVEKNIVSEAVVYEEASRYFNVPIINLKEVGVNHEALAQIPENIAVNHKIIAFESNDKEIKIAALDPEDLEIFEFIRKKTDKELKIFLTTPASIEEGLKQYRGSLGSELKSFEEKSPKDKKNEEGIIDYSAPLSKKEGEEEDLEKMAKDLPIVRIVNNILEYAVSEEASDIHIEPEEKDVIVRYRIDGLLRNVTTLTKRILPGIVARIKILANLKVDEHRLPQDGRFKLSGDKYDVAFRVSIIPAFDGEKIVLRLLNEKSQVPSLEQIGLRADNLKIVQRNISKPHGMILVTGPTGSGKTTTLYTILNILNKPQVNISTVEDPIEYRMPHVNQSQINPKIGFTFAAGLRALLRQDPNIIMVGEIRDEETAEIAVHAAMTGHLLLSTLHTNDAVTTLPRLAQMNIPSFLIASTTNVIISQRLVRKICQFCGKEYEPDAKKMEEIKAQMNLDTMLDMLVEKKVITAAKAKKIVLKKGEGCKKCSNTGYKGRIGIYEVLEVTPEICNLILKNADAMDIKKQAEAQNMLSIAEDGLLKVLDGTTTIEEVIRVTKE